MCTFAQILASVPRQNISAPVLAQKKGGKRQSSDCTTDIHAHCALHSAHTFELCWYPCTAQCLTICTVLHTGVFEHQHSFPIFSYKVAATLLTCVHSWTVASLHKKRCSWYLSKTFTKTNAMFSIQNFSVRDFVVFEFHIQGNYQKVDLQTAHLLRLQSKNGRKNK